MNSTPHDEVIVGIDDSPSSKAALAWAATYARSTGSRLRGVHVLTTTGPSAGGWTPGFPAMAYTAPVETVEQVKAHLRQVFAAVAPEPSWRLDVCTGSAGRELVDRSRGQRLLVIGTREHTGLERLLQGSVSHYCLSHAECPVVAVPPYRPVPVTAISPVVFA